MKKIEAETIILFGAEVAELREMFPEFAREIDRLHFEVGKKHVRQCGHADCECQTLTFEEFHRRRNLCFRTVPEADNYGLA